MKPFICNPVEISLHDTASADRSWVHLLPQGTFQGRDGRGPFEVTDAASIINNSQDYAGGNGIPVDYDHQIDHAKANGQPAIAAGWIKQLEARTNGVWGLVAWTEKAAAHIAAKEYRFLSPVIGVSKSEGGKVNVILRAALTNNPNLTQLEAVAAMEAQTMDEFLQKLQQAMGLPPEATEDDVLKKLATAFNKSPKGQKPAAPGGQQQPGQTQPGQTKAENPDPTKWVSMADFERVVAELNRINQGVEKQAAETHVEEQIWSGRLPPYLRNWGIELCSVNKPGFDGFVDRTKKFWEPLHKSILSGREPPASGSLLTADEQDAASRMNLTEEEFARAKRDTYA